MSIELFEKSKYCGCRIVEHSNCEGNTFSIISALSKYYKLSKNPNIGLI